MYTEHSTSCTISRAQPSPNKMGL